MDDDEQPVEPTPDDLVDGDRAETDTQADTETTTEAVADGRMSRGRLAVLVGSLVVAVIVIAFLALRSDEPAPVATTLSVPSSTTTTTEAPWPATQARVAAAKSPTILVQSAPPPEWGSADQAEVWSAAPVPASQATMPPRDALPRLDYPIQGRYADAAGWSFANPTSFQDPFVMLVTEQRGDWLKVQIPVRPNGTEGYVRASDVDVTTHNYRLGLQLSQRKLTLYDGDVVVLETPVVIGKQETLTPTGRFYVTDKVEQSNPEGAYGPLALPISAYSEQIDEFDNGVPVIALHGTNSPQLLGQDVSNGCVRMPNDVVTRIGATIPLGTPIEIVA